MRRMWVCAMLSGWIALAAAGCKTWQEKYPDLAERIKIAESQVKTIKEDSDAATADVKRLDKKVTQMGGEFIDRVADLEKKASRMNGEVQALTKSHGVTRSDLAKAVKTQGLMQDRQKMFSEVVHRRFTDLGKRLDGLDAGMKKLDEKLDAQMAGAKEAMAKLAARAKGIEDDIVALKKIARQIHDIRQGVLKVFEVFDASLAAKSKRIESELRALQREREALKEERASMKAPTSPPAPPAPEKKRPPVGAGKERPVKKPKPRVEKAKPK